MPSTARGSCSSNTARTRSPPPCPPSSSRRNMASKAAHSITASCTAEPRSCGAPAPRASSSDSSLPTERCRNACSLGSCSLSALARCDSTSLTSAPVPVLNPAYSGLDAKNFCSAPCAASMPTPSRMSACDRFTHATHPCFSLYAFPSSTARASVPLSMMSTLVSTPSVRLPSGSTSRARRTASLVAMSALAGLTASMKTFLPWT
mmetsp:Transcript_1591/g.5481  ORF Transcript_1591/g.5481 Transcript_1591/m.5481 type:complete len:205 (-) Transcript_1591:668-1282(-)